MLIFLDTEFTDFKRSSLISLGLIAEDGREFYAELNDYPFMDSSEFVREVVEPILGRVPDAICSRAELTVRLHDWFNQLPEATVVYDYEQDWLLLVDSVLGKNYKNPPANFGERILLDNSSITHPVFEEAHNAVYTQEFPKHHALADARGLMAGYRAWMAYMEGIWMDGK